MDVEWFAEGRVDQCSYAMLREMANANCRMVYFGIENASQKVLDYYDKQTTPEQAKVAVENARKAGIDVIVTSFILGAPNETRQEIQNTLEFAQKLQVDIPQFNILATFPGTDIWDELKMKGVLNEDQYWETGVLVPEVSPDTVPSEEIERMIHDSYRRFLVRPSYVFTQLFKFSTSPYRLNLIVNNLKRIDTIAESVSLVT